MSTQPSMSAFHAARAAQIYPRLPAPAIERMRRFGVIKHYAPGEAVVRTGQVGMGIAVVLDGLVHVTQRAVGRGNGYDHMHCPGSFIGELAQLSGRPWLADATAVSASQALLIAPERLRALLIAEADLGEGIMRALILRRVGLLEINVGGPVLVGHAGEARTLALETFLGRNGHPHVFFDVNNDPCARTLIDEFHIDPAELPIVLCPNGDLLRRPDEGMLARCLGWIRAIDAARVYDVVVVGAGPAGLATSVYAASEGLSVLTLDCRSFGGQAGASARIENFLGFPTGISGMALMARAYNQAQKFGVELAIPDEAARLGADGEDDSSHVIHLANGELARARTVVVATGARYRRLPIPGMDTYEGTSVHYWASPVETRLCAGQAIALVGGGNSAGQAAVYLASKASCVTLLARRPLTATMSRYLIDRIAAQPNIKLVEGVQPVKLEGRDGALQSILWSGIGGDGAASVSHLFLFIGAEPNTDWLRGSGIALDAGGFIITARTGEQNRLPLETNRQGIFAIGDVRADSVKRVAAAAGDGAQVTASIHQALARSTQQAV